MIGWVKFDPLIKVEIDHYPYFSIIVPARNESKNIELCLSGLVSQNYPTDKFEIIVVNDDSKDNTAELVELFIKAHPQKRVSLINLKNELRLKSPKKRALKAAIDASSGNWIVSTDADCLHPENWLQNFSFEIYSNNPVFISAPVSFFHEDSFFKKLQSLEFASLIGIGAASISNRKPTMCNGANLAFKKEAFYAVNGYDGNEHLASGDDEFLLHKLAKTYHGKISFIKDKGSIVHTNAHSSFKSFINQRKRWVSKSTSYQNKAESFMAYFVWFYHAFSLLLLLLIPFNTELLPHFITLLGTKIIFEFIFIIPVILFFGKLKYIIYYPIAALLYLPYVSLIAFLGKTQFSWKDRSY